MSTYRLEIKFLSDAIIGSAEGYGAVIDTDIVYDEFGFPFIPAKRIKGILRNSADDLINCFKISNINYTIDKNELFGISGQQTGILVFPNFYIEEYEENRKWLRYLKNNKNNYRINISTQKVLDTFTTVRTSTSIENGISEKTSLRKFRCLNAGNSFYGKIDIDDNYAEQLALICQNVGSMGTKRNRGFGRVEITLFNKNKNNINRKALEVFEKEVLL